MALADTVSFAVSNSGSMPCIRHGRLSGVSLSWNEELTSQQDERENYREQCRGMYAKNAMGGNIDPYINIIFSPVKGDEPQIVSLIIFAWSDVLDVGVPEPDGSVVPSPPRASSCNLWLMVESVYLRYSERGEGSMYTRTLWRIPRHQFNSTRKYIHQSNQSCRTKTI